MPHLTDCERRAKGYARGNPFIRSRVFLLLVYLALAHAASPAPNLPSTIVTWPPATYVNGIAVAPDNPGIPRNDPLLDVVAISAADGSTLTIRANGTVGCFGDCSDPSQYAAQLTNVTALSIGRSGHYPFLTLQSNGVVSAWGDDSYGTGSVPVGLADVIAVASGYSQGVALKRDGTVVTWGRNGTNVPAGLTNIVAISAARDSSLYYVLALTRNGTVLSWDYLSDTLSTVDGVSNVVAVSAGALENLGLKNDGTIVSWGERYGVHRPPGLSNVIAIAAGKYHGLALKSDGTVVAWENYPQIPGIADVPAGLSNVVAIAAGVYHSVALAGPLPPSITEQPQDSTVQEASTLTLQVRYIGSYPFSYQWQKDGTNLLGQTNDLLQVPSIPLAGAAGYGVVISNAYGVVTSRLARVTVTAWSQIVTQPKSQTVNAGTNVSFSVGVAGTEPFTYQWQKNGIDLAGATNSTLTLTSVQAADSGDYRVAVSNLSGTKYSLSAHLLVSGSGGPNITVHPASETIFIGGRMAFSVVATGSGPLHYQWRKNGVALINATSSRLEFPPIQASDAGSYDVLVSDNVGSTVSASGSLTVTSHTFTWPTPGAVVCLNGPAPPPDLTNAVAVSASPDHLLALRSDGTVVEWGDSPPPPDPKLGYVPPGLSNVVAISAGDSSISIGLLRDGTVVTWGYAYPPVPPDLFGVIAVSGGGNRHFLALKADGTVVTINGPAVPADLRGVVGVAASGGCDIALKSNGTAILWGSFVSLYLPALTRATDLVAVAAAPSQKHMIGLRADGTLLDYSNLGIGAPDASLPGFSDVVSMAPAGLYSIVLKRDGTVRGWSGSFSGSAPLSFPSTLSHVKAMAAGGPSGLGLYTMLALTDWPVIIQDPQSLIVDQGGSASFTVVAGGAPLSFQWQKNGQNISGADNASFTIGSVAAQDAGDYTVVVSTPAGSITSAVATLMVNTTPSMVQQPKSETLFDNARVVFSASASGSLPLSYQWQRDGANLSGQTNSTLTISSVHASDIGDYRVLVGNNYGTATSAVARLQLVAFSFTVPPAGTVVSLGGAMVPAGLTNAVGIAGGDSHSVALLTNGTVVEWGDSPPPPLDITSWAPPGLSNVVAIAAGGGQTLALLRDGTVVGWQGPEAPTDLFGVIAISAGRSHCIALKADGTVRTWGIEPLNLSNVISIVAGYNYNLAIRNDGTVAAWGNSLSLFTVEINSFTNETDWIGFAGAHNHLMGLRNNGTVLDYGNLIASNRAPAGLSNVISIAAGNVSGLALKSDGTVVGWNGPPVPEGISNVVAIAAGGQHDLLITATPPLPVIGASLGTNQINIFTPVSVPGFILESSADVSQPFTPVGVGSSVLVFDDNTNAAPAIVLPLSSGRQFFRLRKTQ